MASGKQGMFESDSAYRIRRSNEAAAAKKNVPLPGAKKQDPQKVPEITRKPKPVSMPVEPQDETRPGYLKKKPSDTKK